MRGIVFAIACLSLWNLLADDLDILEQKCQELMLKCAPESGINESDIPKEWEEVAHNLSFSENLLAIDVEDRHDRSDAKKRVYLYYKIDLKTGNIESPEIWIDLIPSRNMKRVPLGILAVVLMLYPCW